MSLLKSFFLFLFLLECLGANEYPSLYSQLGTPLYKSAQKLSVYTEVKLLRNNIIEFQEKAKNLREYGLSIDSLEDKKDKKSYLKELRKLQKSYEYTLSLLHKEIEKSIKNENYDAFIKLTSCELDGLFKNRNLRNKAIEFYTQNKKANTVCKVLDTQIENEKLLQETTQEFYNEIIHSTYSSSKSNTQSKKSVSIFTKRVHNKVYVSFKNSNPYDVTVAVKTSYENIMQTPNTPAEFVLKANSTFSYTTLEIGKGKSSYGYSYSWIIGNKDAVHDDSYLYRFPFALGSSYRISQGYNGAYTHKGHSKYALDFVMHEGTKVYAARDGLVIRTKSDSNSGGYDKKFAKDGNYVTILHSDATMATYYHLQRYGVVVKVGEKVQRGALLGYSGNTGYSSGPHLHFAVFTAKSARTTRTIAVEFISEKGVVEVPTQGHSYVAK